MCFESDELRNSSLHANFYDSFIAAKLQGGFTGRKDLFPYIESFLMPPGTASATPTAAGTQTAADVPGTERVMVITGEPGIGKSTTMAVLISRTPLVAGGEDVQPFSAVQKILLALIPPFVSVIGIVDSYLTGDTDIVEALGHSLVASHICMASHSITLEPIRFVRSIAVQFAQSKNKRVSGFADRLTASDSTLTALRSNDAVTAFVAVLSLLSSTTAATGADSTISDSGTSDRCVFVVVDSLDESLCISSQVPTQRTDRNQPMQTIAGLLSSREVINAIPEWMRVITTSRPDSAVLSQLDLWCKPRIRAIDKDEAQNRRDVESFVRAKLAIESCDLIGRQPAETVNNAVGIAVRLSAGNFLVASELVRFVKIADSDGKWSLVALQKLAAHRSLVPGNLSSYYATFLTRQSITDQKWRVLRLIIEVLLASHSPISLDWLCYAIRLTESAAVPDAITLKSYIRLIEPFIRWDRHDTAISLYHQSFSDWLRLPRTRLSHDRFAVDVAAGHRRLAAAALLVGPKVTPKIVRAVMGRLLKSAAAPPDPPELGQCQHVAPTAHGASVPHCSAAHFESIVSHLYAGGMESLHWPALRISELCYYCYADIGASFILIQRNDVEGVRATLNLWSPKHSHSALRHAVELGRHEIVRLLWPLCERKSLDDELPVAPNQETIDVLVRLGANGAHANLQHTAVTFEAGKHLLAKCGLDVNKFLLNPGIPIQLLQWIIDRKGLNPEYCDAAGYTALHHMVQGWGNDDRARVRLLLAAGWNANARTRAKESVLMLCAGSSMLDMVLTACDPLRNPLAELQSSPDEMIRYKATYIEKHPKWGVRWARASASAPVPVRAPAPAAAATPARVFAPAPAPQALAQAQAHLPRHRGSK